MLIFQDFVDNIFGIKILPRLEADSLSKSCVLNILQKLPQKSPICVWLIGRRRYGKRLSERGSVHVRHLCSMPSVITETECSGRVMEKEGPAAVVLLAMCTDSG